jgi:hypothetical protein
LESEAAVPDSQRESYAPSEFQDLLAGGDQVIESLANPIKLFVGWFDVAPFEFAKVANANSCSRA